MDDTTNTYLPPTPSEVFQNIAPTMADIDYYFENVISKALRDAPTARSLLAGQSLKLDVDKVLYKAYGDEIINRLTEQGWDAQWAEWGIGTQVAGDTKPLFIRFTRKSHDVPEIELPQTNLDKVQSLHDAWSNLLNLLFEPIVKHIDKIAQWLGLT